MSDFDAHLTEKKSLFRWNQIFNTQRQEQQREDVHREILKQRQKQLKQIREEHDQQISPILQKRGFAGLILCISFNYFDL